MPKLTIKQRTYGKAVAALLKLYKSEPDFIRELEKLHKTYSKVFEQWLKLAIPNWIKMRENLTQKEFSAVKDYFLTVDKTISASLAKKVDPFLSMEDPNLADQMNAYVKSLSDLAYRWQLRAPWAGSVLLTDHVLNMLPEDVKKTEIPVEVLEPLLPSAPLQPLKFEVNAYELMYSGRQEIRDRFVKALADYEKELKSLGWQELPSAIEKHAYWWFEHYVHHKKYPELEQEEQELRVVCEGIKKAVWRFSKVLSLRSSKNRGYFKIL